MQFLFPALTWGFVLVLAPLLIHLINLMRQQKVEWAAMEFLLQSYKKHRRWIWLKQLFLLLLRMLVVAVVVAMLAGLMTREQAGFLQGSSTHHFILLDDSMSMGDRSSDGTAMDRAAGALRTLAQRLAEAATDQRVTLVRFSSAADGGSAEADLNAAVVDADFAQTMDALQSVFDATELAPGADAALELAERLVDVAVEQRKVVYVISDFREEQWQQLASLKERLRALRRGAADVHLVRCVDEQHDNLAVTDLVPEPGTLAAGVPLLMNVEVTNWGPTDMQQVTLRVGATSYPRDVFIAAGQQVPEEQVSTLVIDEIPAGESVIRQTQFKFARSGQHVIQASLNADSLLADNQRRCLVNLPASVPVLLVDGSAAGEEAYYLESTFAPGRVATGIQPVNRPVSYLRDVVDTELAQFAAVYITNVERLDPRAVSALERYVRGGGGLAIFTGPNCDPAFLMQWYGDGQGVFPLPVQAERDWTHTPGEEGGDLQVNDHPVFRVLVDEGGKNRPLTQRIRVDRYHPPDPAWEAGDHPEVNILASLRGQDPLVVSQPFGDGVVVCFLTTASPTWNNWALGPSFPVVVLQLHGYLSSSGQSFQRATTGELIEVQLDTAEYLPEMTFHTPADALGESSKATLQPQTVSQDSGLATFRLGAPPDPTTRRSGLYVADVMTLERQSRQLRFAVNPPVSEGRLALIPSGDLETQLGDLDVTIHTTESWDYASVDPQGFAWSHWLAFALIAMLIGEQFLAYSASYHPHDEGLP